MTTTTNATKAFVKSLAKPLTKALTLAAVVGVSALAAPTLAAASEHCKNVYIKVVNSTGGEVKIIDLDYQDYGSGKWESEPTKNRVIGAGQVWAFKKRLERVGGEKTRIRIDYRAKERRLLSKWSKVRNGYSGSKTCYDGSSFEVVLR